MNENTSFRFSQHAQHNPIVAPSTMLPPALVAGAAKVWGQRTSDGRFALVYNPSREKRYPLVMVHGDDGIAFRDMRVVHGESPRLRYAGEHKDLGGQYVRGLAEWSNDGTFADAKNALWNVYSPRWAPVGIVKDDATGPPCIELRDGDPYDYARAVRLFPATQRVTVELQVKAAQTNHRLEIDLCGRLSPVNPAQHWSDSPCEQARGEVWATGTQLTPPRMYLLRKLLFLRLATFGLKVAAGVREAMGTLSQEA